MSETVVLDGIRWETYESLRADLDAREQHVHLTFDRGCLEIEMSPLPVHEDRAWLLSHIVEIVAEDRGIDYLPGGSTTFRRGELGRGAEPDACYFLGDVPLAGVRPAPDPVRLLEEEARSPDTSPDRLAGEYQPADVFRADFADVCPASVRYNGSR